ncbi:anaphase-promoting complex subunit 8-like [Magnolia sinica]|uniref:anaphase-promoting complex subunit 8-like n=1 Tax=Magnolia sinica TaxID=86752 RepID=UPI002658C727|nr:anaphase-promoting complex subunit 8-like [Magnolia sinica]
MASSTSMRESYRSELCTAIRQLRDRCLYSASKWAAEQLVGIKQDPAKVTNSHHQTRLHCSSGRTTSSTRHHRFHPADIASTPLTGVSYIGTPVLEEEQDDVKIDYFLLAKSYFDCREYRRAAHVLRDQIGKKAIFLRCYALYLVRSISLHPGLLVGLDNRHPAGPGLYGRWIRH